MASGTSVSEAASESCEQGDTCAMERVTNSTEETSNTGVCMSEPPGISSSFSSRSAGSGSDRRPADTEKDNVSKFQASSGPGVSVNTNKPIDRRARADKSLAFYYTSPLHPGALPRESLTHFTPEHFARHARGISPFHSTSHNPTASESTIHHKAQGHGAGSEGF
ncbi:hypothetical protein EYF80_003841 [Liparis tanakae]|uniref:Uncharacterized protein n=1 Tax=Liparis tanakae TaxID=230148 RepID=A0A4Z2J7J7_9TELE|nr:hypothetical protein EYF80_003841 [Liparis tanakae]